MQETPDWCWLGLAKCVLAELVGDLVQAKGPAQLVRHLLGGLCFGPQPWSSVSEVHWPEQPQTGYWSRRRVLMTPRS